MKHQKKRIIMDASSIFGLTLTKKARKNLKVINKRENKKKREAKIIQPKKCYICGAMENLVNHHVNGGKKKHRDENPYQKVWEQLNFNRVWLCKPHEDKVHRRNKRVTKYLSWFLEAHPELAGEYKNG